MTETLRTFIAIDLSPDVRDALASAQKALQGIDPGAAHAVKWVDSGSIHLTLKFLGDTPTGKIEPIRAALEKAAAGIGPLSLCLGQPGCFPNARQPRVLWIGIEGEVDELRKLAAAIEQTVSPLGFPTEHRPFSPHLTLGRVRDDATPDERRRIGAAIQSLHPPQTLFTVGVIALMRSDLRPTGAVYTRLAEAALRAASS